MTTESILNDVANERKRQVEVEGWTMEHDDKHDFGEMAAAAACYSMPPHRRAWSVDPYLGQNFIAKFWPWTSEWWKPKNRRYDLVRAAALIVAEIERLDRIGV